MHTKYLWFQENQSNFSGILKFEEPLARHTYYHIGGPTRVFAIPKSMEDFHWLSQGLQQTKSPFFVLGRGSNVLVSDQGFDGLVVQTGLCNRRLAVNRHHQKLSLEVGASVSLRSLLKQASDYGWKGLEFLAGIPGSLGGAIWMNAGTHLGAIADIVLSVQAYVWQSTEKLWILKEYSQDALQFAYRKNLFLPQRSIIWQVQLKIQQGDPQEVKEQIHQVLVRRKETQPLQYPSCGSVFKNPPGRKAWEVLENLGLRGYRRGQAQFSEKHCNFIVNLGQAQASDIKALIELAQDQAYQQYQLHIETEVIFLGF